VRGAVLRLLLVLGIGFLVIKPYFEKKRVEQRTPSAQELRYMKMKKSLQHQIVRLEYEIGRLKRKGVQNNIREYSAKTKELEKARHDLKLLR